MAAKKSLSKTQIDKLGERLKIVERSEDDLRLLEEYRSSFSAAYELALDTIRGLGEFPTGRVAKTTQSISAKLRRESLRLSQMQDIAGCRIIVPAIAAQNQFVAALKSNFPLHILFDRREKSSHGYRAVHLVVQVLGLPVEIQVRTILQQSWAELCEKAADLIDPEIKYGGGPDWWKRILEASSNAISRHEKLESEASDFKILTLAKIDEISQLHRMCLSLTSRAEEFFSTIQPGEFSRLIHSNEAFCTMVEEILEDLDSKNELQTPRSLDQILVCIRRFREEIKLELAEEQATLAGCKPMQIEASKVIESNRAILTEKLSQIADVLNSLEKSRTENPQ